VNIEENKGECIYMNMKLVDEVTASQIKKDVPSFRAGDTVKVHVRIVEGGKSRVQNYEGVVIARSGRGVSQTFTVRKISNQVGVERIFSLNSPLIEKIDVLRTGSVRRSKLYYLRDRSGKSARIKDGRRGKKVAALLEAEGLSVTEPAPVEEK